MSALRPPPLDGGAAATSRVRLVLGNESADLDSVVCALVHAFHLSVNAGAAVGTPPPPPPSAGAGDTGGKPTQDHHAHGRPLVEYITVPIVNTPRKDLPLRTDVKWMLERARVDWTHLFFSDDADVSRLRDANGPAASVVLVDHNRVTKEWEGLARAVDVIIDHHEDRGAHSHATRTIRPCGSCASLVTLAVANARSDLSTRDGGPASENSSSGSITATAATFGLDSDAVLGCSVSVDAESTFNMEPEAAELLLAAIMADTAGMTNRVTPEDEVAVELLARCCPKVDRTKLWRDIQRVKCVVASYCCRSLVL